MSREGTFRSGFYVAVPVAAVLFTLAIVELGLALFRPVPFSIESNMYFEPDPFTGYRHRPNSTGYYQRGIPARANENGHRDEPVSLDKPAGVSRILVLGDSFTVGASVPQEDAYPEVLEAMLSRDASTRVEVINAGVGGWDPFQYAQYYAQYGHTFSPDLILIGFFVGNDTYDQSANVGDLPTAVQGRRVPRRMAASPFIHLKVFLYRHSHLARLAQRRAATLVDFTRRDCSEFNKVYLAIQHSRLPSHFKRTSVQENLARNGIKQILRIKKLARRESIPVAVVLIPDENQVNPQLQRALFDGHQDSRFDFDMPQAMLKDMLSAASIPVLDRLPHFRTDPRCLYMNDTHWTSEGHALAAQVIHDAMTGEKTLPNPLDRSGARP